MRGTLILAALNLGLSACESARSYERTSDGSTTYLDQLSDAAKLEARRKIATSLTQGSEFFALEPGDEIEIFFHIDRTPTSEDYLIRVGDKLQVDFLSETETGRTVQVRPDGRISLPLIGPVIAVGQTPDGLAQQLRQRYGSLLPGAQITVNVTEPHSVIDDFLDMLGTPTKGRSLVDRVLPDGTISVPLLPPINARGRQLLELAAEIDAAYSAKGLNVTVSLVPRGVHASTTFVLGEVGKPGRLEMDRPRTVLMALAQAGGVLSSGSIDSVRLYYVGEDGMPRLRSINLREVMDDLKLEQDMIVPNNSIIYVPPTELAKLGRLEDAIFRDILRYNGVNIGGAWIINNQSNNNSRVVPNPNP